MIVHFGIIHNQKNMQMKFKDYLIGVTACDEARNWNGNRTLSQCWQDCERGDWMLWLMKKANMCDLRTLTLAKARCAELAKPYMKYPRSLAALQAAFDFANGLISEQELTAAATATDAYDAYAAAAAAYAAYAAAATDAYAYAAAAAAAAAADAAAYAAYAAAATDAYAAAADTRISILKKCADICREVLVAPNIENVDDK